MMRGSYDTSFIMGSGNPFASMTDRAPSPSVWKRGADEEVCLAAGNGKRWYQPDGGCTDPFIFANTVFGQEDLRALAFAAHPLSSNKVFSPHLLIGFRNA